METNPEKVSIFFNGEEINDHKTPTHIKNILPNEYIGTTCDQCRREDGEIRKRKSNEIKEYNDKHESDKKKCKKCGKIIESEIIYSNGKSK